MGTLEILVIKRAGTARNGEHMALLNVASCSDTDSNFAIDKFPSTGK